MWLHTWLYHFMRGPCGYTHLSVLWQCTLLYTVIYVVMHHGAWLYVCFYIKCVDIHRSPTLAFHQIWLYPWLYHTMRGYTLNVRLYTFICTLAFHCTICGYTLWYVVIPHIRVIIPHSTYTVDYQTTSINSVQMRRLSNDVQIS